MGKNITKGKKAKSKQNLLDKMATMSEKGSDNSVCETSVSDIKFSRERWHQLMEKIDNISKQTNEIKDIEKLLRISRRKQKNFRLSVIRWKKV